MSKRTLPKRKSPAAALSGRHFHRKFRTTSMSQACCAWDAAARCNRKEGYLPLSSEVLVTGSTDGARIRRSD